MAHLIMQHDRTYSIKGSEWHGLARVPLAVNGAPVSTLTRDIIKDILFNVIPLTRLRASTPGTGLFDGPIPLDALAELQRIAMQIPGQTHTGGMQSILTELESLINGAPVAVPGKTVAADLRDRGEGLVPLATHSSDYNVINNGEIFHAIETALAEFPHVVSTAGTLDNCRRFYTTVQLSGDGQGFTVGNDEFHGYLNFITSHDGTLACQAYDSLTRIVCNNTLRASLGSAKHKVYIRHTKGSSARLEGVAAFIGDVLAGRQEWAAGYDRAANTGIKKENALALITSFFHQQTGGKDEISTRTRNNIDSVFTLFQDGKGNHGETVADVLNGFTEFYTSGAGVGTTRGGRDITPVEKAVNGHFGSAADVKAEFARIILTPDGREFQELVEAAPAAMSAYARGAGLPTPVYMSGIERTRAATGQYGERVAVNPAFAFGRPDDKQGSDLDALLDSPLPPKQ